MEGRLQVKIINERNQIRDVASRWREQYGQRKAAISERLDALDGETATAADVEAIIGNRSWTSVQACDECKREAAAVVEIGQEPDYESRTAYICLDCINAAAALLNPLPARGGGSAAFRTDAVLICRERDGECPTPADCRANDCPMEQQLREGSGSNG